MADHERAKKKKAKLSRERKERRFVPEPTYASTPPVVAGLVGAFLLGSGVYGSWLTEAPPAYARYLVGLGALGVAGALWFSDAGAQPVRVGDFGIALEKGSEITRLLWCDIKRVALEGGTLVLRAEGQRVAIPVAAQRAAVAWILAETARRIPDALDVKSKVVDGLPKPKDTDGDQVLVEGLQLTGRHCAQSGKAITFEREARLCPNCAQVYLRGETPAQCVTCSADLENKAA